MKNNKDNYAIIMAGGIGSRFWPVSKRDFPKQFIDILGVGKSLLRLTYERFEKFFPKENIYVVTNESYDYLVKQQLPELLENQIISEPAAMNTATCIAYASFKIASVNPSATCVVAPSDHLILNEEKFREDINKALAYTTENNALLTLGIKPDRPDTGYGYIQYIDSGSSTKDGIFKVKTFTEKPSHEIALTFLESGDFLWNAGIFIWKVSDILQQLELHLPDTHKLFKDGAKKYNTPEEYGFIQKIYPQSKSISIDYAVMEKADNVFVVPSDFGWSDLGTWKSLHELREKDLKGNMVHGKNVMTQDCEDSLVFANNPEKLIVVNGLKNYIVVDTDKVLLICNLDKEQEVKQIVDEVKNVYKGKFT